MPPEIAKFRTLLVALASVGAAIGALLAWLIIDTSAEPHPAVVTPVELGVTPPSATPEVRLQLDVQPGERS